MTTGDEIEKILSKRNNNNKTFNHPSGKSHAELLEHVHYQVSLKKTKRCVQSVTGIFGFLFLGALIFYELETYFN